MSLTPTKQIELGFKAPDFSLLDVVSDEYKSLDDLRGELGTVVMFICNHCPFVVHVREGLVELANKYLEKGVKFIAISSNDVVNYPQDGPSEMKSLAAEFKFPFPYLFDETQQVAREYDAACTPDFNVFDKDLNCVYRGQMDDSRPGNEVLVTGDNLSAVCDDLILGKIISSTGQIPSVGCNIKWK